MNMNAKRSLGAWFVGGLCALPFLVSTSFAGNVLRVGAGQTFANVQDAVNAAQSGDLVLVEPGTYPPFQLGSTGLGPKQLSIAASSGSFSIAATPGIPEILVENIPLGRTVSILGAHITWADPAAPAVLVRNCPGAVRLSGLDVAQSANLPGASVSATVEVANTKSFWLIDSSIWGPTLVGDTTSVVCVGGICNDGISGLQLTDSSGMIQNSRTRGLDNSPTAAVTGYGGDGLRLIGESSVWMLQNVVGGAFGCRFKGGDGFYGGNAIHQIRTPTAAALNRSCGGATSPSWEPGRRMLAGVGHNGGFYGFNNTNGSISSGHGAVAFQVPALCDPDEENETSVQASLVSIGGNFDVSLRTRTARQYMLLISDSTRYDRTTPLAGRAMLLSNRVLVSSGGTTAAQTTAVLSFPIPAATSLIGTQATAQAITGPVGGAFDALSLPTMAVVGP